MKKTRSFKLEVAQIIVSTFVVVVFGLDTIGQPARLVFILTIVAGSLSVGIALGRLIERRRKEKKTEPTSL